jgi:hypothetical protein
MRLRLHVSWLFLLAGALWGGTAAPRQHSPRSALAGALLVAYVVWSLYWGIPLFWRYWRLHSHRLGNVLRGVPPPLRLALRCSLCVAGAYFFSVFGGGIYEFIRCWRALRGPA